MLSIDKVILSVFPEVTTHLKHANDHSSSVLPYDAIIALAAVTYNRYTVKYPNEAKWSRGMWTVILGYLAYNRYDYWIQGSVHLLSFCPYFYHAIHDHYSKVRKTKIPLYERAGPLKEMAAHFIIFAIIIHYSFQGCKGELEEIRLQTKVLSIVMSAYFFVVHMLYSLANPSGVNSIFQSKMYKVLVETPIISKVIENLVEKMIRSLGCLFPIEEIKSAHDILIEFMDPRDFYAKVKYLLFVTFHIQVGMGFLGISFLRAEQNRKNALVKIEDQIKLNKLTKVNDDGAVKSNGEESKKKNNKLSSSEEKDPSEKFRRSAGPFIFLVALPYMVQIVLYGALNMHAFHCFRDDVHRTIRLNDLFDNDGSRFVATASSKLSNLTPSGEFTLPIQSSVHY